MKGIDFFFIFFALAIPSVDLQGDVEHEFTGSVEGLAHRCVEVVYMTTLLRDGYGFPEHSRDVTYALESDGMEVSSPRITPAPHPQSSWFLGNCGKVVYGHIL